MFKNGSKFKSKKVIAGLIVILSLIGLRLYLPVIAKDFITQQINRDPDYRGSIGDVEIHLIRGAYALDDLKIEKVEGQKTYPLISVDQIEIGLSWRELFHR